MSLNWKEIDLALAELDPVGAQIQKVWQPAYDLLALQLYKEGRAFVMLAALTPGACRLHLATAALPKTAKPLRFAEFFKSRLKDGWIDAAGQLGADRIVRLAVRRGDERFLVYLRLWSNAANLIVADDGGTILDAMRRSPKRGEVGGGHYAPEPVEPTAEQLAMRPRDLPGEGSFSRRIEAWYAEHAGALSLDALREQAAKAYGGRIRRLSAAIAALEDKRAAYAAADDLKRTGDLIMANLGTVAPGAEWLETISFYTGAAVRIKLDPRKSLPANAERYYDQYRKAKAGLGEVQAELAAGRAELAKLEAELAARLAETDPLRLARALRAKPAGTPASAGKNRPGLAFRRSGWLLLVGRSAAENDELLRRHVKGSDLWLHARDYPGAYVFVKARSGKSVPLDILLDAGNLAVFYSKARNSGEADLYYTPVKYLRRAKNGPKGLVLPTQEKNLRIRMEPNRLKSLEACKEE
jgi:predicted ribosome quality control (RQC) complex YloA/Tae2 family protein